MWVSTVRSESTRRVAISRFVSSDADRHAAVLALLRIPASEFASGKPLYEARASSEGWGSDARSLLGPLFAAALMDFPAAGPNPRTVRVNY